MCDPPHHTKALRSLNHCTSTDHTLASTPCNGHFIKIDFFSEAANSRDAGMLQTNASVAWQEVTRGLPQLNTASLKGANLLTGELSCRDRRQSTAEVDKVVQQWELCASPLKEDIEA